jgi:hypothetical protein
LLEQQAVPLSPAAGATGQQGAKRLILKRFPYDVVVREGGNEIIVVAIAYQPRRPGYWKNRF